MAPAPTRAWSSKRDGLVLLTVVAMCLLLAVGCSPSAPEGPPGGPAVIQGRVVGMNGEAVPGATLSTATSSAVSREDGTFTVDVGGAGSWVSATRAGYLPRTRAAKGGSPLLFRLTPDDGRTVSLQFTGDIMTGRRFFDPNGDGDTEDARLPIDAGPTQYRDLLSPVAPLLSSTDLTISNVETTVVPAPYFDPRGLRPTTFHPTKEFVYASAPGLPSALAQAGIDVVNLANNHQYDRLENGVRSTNEAFSGAGFTPGFGQYGDGPNVATAYVPAVREVKGARFAFLGCTTVTGVQQPIAYAADDVRGGAAPCDEARIRAAVSAEVRRGSFVVFSIHGGFEYDRTTSPLVERFRTIAVEAGAKLIMDHHPHVVGGLAADPVTAFSLGNLVFDQTIWPTFQAYTMTVDVRDGQIVRAYLEPLQIDDYVAHGIDGSLADYVCRTAAGIRRGPFAIEDGAVEVDVSGRARNETVSQDLAGSPNGTAYEVSPGWLAQPANAALTQSGEDLLWVGGFEDEALGSGPGALWNVDGNDKTVLPDPSGAPDRVLRIRRSPGDQQPAATGPSQRALLNDPRAVALRASMSKDREVSAPIVVPRSAPELSLLANIRMPPGARVEVQLSWYDDLAGGSQSQTIVPIDGGDDQWRPLRLDARAPDRAVAVGLFIKLYPPGAVAQTGSQQLNVYLDDLRLVEWNPRGAPTSGEATHVRTFADTQVAAARSLLPGAPAPAPTMPGPLRRIG